MTLFLPWYLWMHPTMHQDENRRGWDVKRIKITERKTDWVSAVQTPDSMCLKWSRPRMQSIQFGALANRGESESIRVEDLWGCLWPNWALGIDSLFPVAFHKGQHTLLGTIKMSHHRWLLLCDVSVYSFISWLQITTHTTTHTHTLSLSLRHNTIITAQTNHDKVTPIQHNTVHSMIATVGSFK